MRLQNKLALIIVLLTGIASASIGWFAYNTTSNRLFLETDRSLFETIEHVPSPRFMRELEDNDGQTPPILNRQRGLEQVLLQYIAPGGTVTTNPGALAIPVTEKDIELASFQGKAGVQTNKTTVVRNVKIEGEPYRVITRSLGNGEGALQAARNTNETIRILSALRNKILVATLIFIFVVIIISWFFAYKLTRRLVHLTNAAEEVKETGDLTVSIQQQGSDEVSRLSEAFSSMLTSLATAKASQQQLIQDAGHELRTPLTSLRTNISVLQRHTNIKKDDFEQILSDLSYETKELTDLVNEIIELATDQRSNEGKELISLQTIVERVIEKTKRRSNQTIRLEADNSLIVAQPSSIERAIQNLVENACKFTEEDTQILIQVKNGTVLVHDQGPGINESDLPHLFDRFYRSIESRSLPGSGLGLAIVKDIIAKHGGSVFVQNRDVGGSTFGFTLPISETTKDMPIGQ